MTNDELKGDMLVTRLRVFAVLFMLVVAILVIGGIRLFRTPPPLQSWRLPDGSKISLATVTYGKKHQLRYDNRWQDFLYPFFPAKVQSKFGSRVATHTSSSSNAVVVWLWHRQTSAAARAMGPGAQPDYQLATLDENGLESELGYGPNCSYFLPASGDTLSGWELKEYPRYGKQIAIRVYTGCTTGNCALAADFKIPNQIPAIPSSWVAEKLPVTRNTNDLEITLEKLETGLTTEETGMGPAGKDAKSHTRAEFSMREQGRMTEDWSVMEIMASGGSGEVRPVGSSNRFWRDHRSVFSFTGALWLDEPAWKLKLEVARTDHFPPGDLWIIKGVRVPESGKINEVLAHTNTLGEEIEFLGLSSPLAKLPQDWTGIRPNANIHARTPFPLSGTRLTLVEVRDDQGRKVETRGSSSSSSTGGRGATVRQMEYGYAIKIPDGAKTFDVTFAFSRSRFVEFLAKPTLSTLPTKR